MQAATDEVGYMNYRNSEMKIDQMVGYLNEEKINLSPPFQRGHVWTLKVRKSLLKNIVLGKPIPAVFLYKEASGSRYSYNILDGKQRLESLILYIGNRRQDLKVENWTRYFSGERYSREAQFCIDLNGSRKAFHDLDEQTVRDFREYAIPTIEIDMGDETGLDEIISLFVDVNQQGVAVSRFDIVKAMFKEDPLMKAVFKLTAVYQRRGQDVVYKMINNEFTFVLKRLQIIENIKSNNSRVDRMWEKLLEIVLFAQSRKHRKPVEILKGFISRSSIPSQRLTPKEVRDLRLVFRFLANCYRKTTLAKSKLSTDHTHFYTMVTSIISGNLFDRFPHTQLMEKLAKFGGILDGTMRPPRRGGARTLFKEYQELSTKQTTDVSRRTERGQKFVEILELL
jgi:hypothetical protein